MRITLGDLLSIGAGGGLSGMPSPESMYKYGLGGGQFGGVGPEYRQSIGGGQFGGVGPEYRQSIGGGHFGGLGGGFGRF